jgi:hypothetical protein
VRSGRCLLQDFSATKHAAECREAKRPLVILWGDSHAAALYPGLRKATERRGFGLTQWTQAGCGPVLDMPGPLKRENCNKLNRQLLEAIVVEQPDVVVLDAAWIHEHYPLSHEQLASLLARTLAELRSRLPRSDIVVLGPTPSWNVSPQATVVSQWMAAADRSASIPVRQKASVPAELDRLLEDVSARSGARFLSISRAMCDAQGCLTRAGPAATDFVATDATHLSPAGASFVVERIEAELFARLAPGRGGAV